jgi:hypothetical protein
MNKVLLSDLEQLIDSAEKEEYIFFNKVLVVEYKLPSGFTVQGRAACVDPANFDLEIGRKIARDEAINQMWQLEGYKLQEKLFKQGVL